MDDRKYDVVKLQPKSVALNVVGTTVAVVMLKQKQYTEDLWDNALMCGTHPVVTYDAPELSYMRLYKSVEDDQASIITLNGKEAKALYNLLGSIINPELHNNSFVTEDGDRNGK